MKTNKHLLILLVLSVFLLFGTSCMVYRTHPHQRGEVITTRPYGRTNRERHEHRIKITDDRNNDKRDRKDDDDHR